jgi:DNA-binding PadR family transcriptional regulator
LQIATLSVRRLCVTLLDYHVLLALSAGSLHGYAIKDAVAADSGGTQAPRAGTLYRVIARLTTTGWVRETAAPGADPAHPGHARRYYALTALGRRALAEQARVLRGAAAQAERRLGASGRS